MNRCGMSALLLVVGLGSVFASEPVLRAGVYSVSLKATEGSRKGGVAKGKIELRPASAADTSPRTGARAKDPFRGPPLFVGWIEADLASIGAPLCTDADHPSPDSRDPIYPGVMVIVTSQGPQRAAKLPTLLVGTLTNLRDGSMWTDGCGFGMYLLGRDGRCYAGQWSHWGLRADGSGTFQLCPDR